MSLSAENIEPYPTIDRPLRIGIVGSGLVSHWHHTGMRLSNRWTLLAGSLSSRPERVAKLGREWSLAAERNYGSYTEMAQQESQREDGIEAVAICTPNHTHRAIAESFMDAGIDIICDKPVANTVADVEALQSLRSRTGLVFAVTHPYVYHPMVRQARTMIAQGAIGELRQFIIEYAQDWAAAGIDMSDDKMVWRRDPARGGRTGTTADIGTHAFQMIEHVLQQPVARLRAELHSLGPGAGGMDDTAFINLRMQSGAPGLMWLTQVAPGEHCGLRFRIYGDQGSLRWDQEFPEHLHYTPLNEAERVLFRGHGRGILPEAERMLKLPRGHGEALSDAWGNLYTEIAITVAARRGLIAMPEGMLAVPDIREGLRGVAFTHAAADSHERDGAWMTL